MVSSFDLTGNMARPWADAGYLCYCVDVQHQPGERRDGNIIYVGANMLDWMPPRGEIAFAAFFPPCTDVSVSGARWFRKKGLGKLIESLQLFERSRMLGEYIAAPYFIENPVSVFSSYAGKPDYAFDPSDYTGFELGDNYSKKTCLWTGGGFVMPDPAKAQGLGEPDDRIHKMAPSDDRANLRSATPMGFARAVFEANRPDRLMVAA